MKTPILSFAAITAAVLLATAPADACTNLIVGKAASVDGSVICTYNCDGFGFASSLSYSAPGRHAPGEMIALRGYGPDSPVHYIPQAEYTYAVVGLMNENQVSIVETTWDGREELRNPEGWLDYFTLMDLALQRSKTAREAIAVMHGLVQEYGYGSTGESFAICDKEEAWIMEIIGKGPGRKGAIWVAMRVPDDAICAYANASRIRQFPQARKADKKLGFCVVDGECMYAADAISFAREMGYFTGEDKDFSFREAYGPLDFSAIRYCEARVWSFFRHHYDTDVMDGYLPFLNGNTDECDHLPLWITPKEKVSVRDIMNDMRDHYEGTALDMTADVSAGPWASPYRNQPVNFKSSDGTDMFRERPIGCQQSGMTMVCQMRSSLPDAVGGVTYFNMDDATMVAYVPVYCGINRVPEPFLRENNNIREFSTESAFWMNNFVANMIYPRWSAMIGDLRDAQQELEDYYAADQKEVEERATAMTPGERAEYLTGKTFAYTDRMMQRWDKLARLLIVKHNDQIMQPSENGVLVPGRRTSPAYAPAFIDAVKAQTGSRYLKPTNLPVMGEYTTVDTTVPEVSGLSLAPDGNSLLAASDENGVYHVSFTGETVPFYTEGRLDCEGVTLDPATGDVYYVVERKQEVRRLRAPDYKESELLTTITEVGYRTNSGLEAITWMGDGTLLLGNQAKPRLLIRYSVADNAIVGRTEIKEGIDDISDLCYDPVRNALWIADSELRTINLCTLDGVVLATYPVPFIDNGEGLYVDRTHQCIWVGDDTTSKLYKISFSNL